MLIISTVKMIPPCAQFNLVSRSSHKYADIFAIFRSFWDMRKM